MYNKNRTDMKDFDYDKFCDTIMVALTFLVSLTFATMFVIHLFSGVGATSLLWECVMGVGTIYMCRYSYIEYKNLNK